MKTTQARAVGDGPRIEVAGPLLIAGLSIRLTATAATDIPALWQRFGAHIGKVPGQIASTAYGVCRENEAGGVEYLCGVEVRSGADLPADFSRWHLPAHRYAVFTHAGHVSTLRETIHAAFSEGLPKAGYVPAKSPFFERYGAEFDLAAGTGGMEVWIPV
jgi:AraC family transcriptional regulator